MIVLDASVTLAGFFEDERTPSIVAIFDSLAASYAVVPGLWRLEVANGFRMAVRRGRANTEFRDAALARLMRLPITIDDDTNTHAWDETLRLADRHDLTPYDASYLELAQRRRVALATLDRALHAAADLIGVQTIDTGLRAHR